MKKTMITMLGVALLMSSCGTYTAEGAYVGAQFGTILGSAVGGISGGWRGSDIGAVVGMAGGAVVGAAIGQAADQKAEERAEVYRRERIERRAERQQEPYGAIDSDDSGFDATGGGDDRVDFGISGPSGEAPSVPAPKEMPSVAPQDGSSVSVEDLQNHRPQIELCNIRIVGNSQPGELRAGEQCKVVFEIMNRTRHTLMDIQPIVEELSGNKHLHISPNLHIESIAPGTGVRYTATIKADKRLKDGQAVLRIAVAHHNREQESQTQQFTLRTLKH